ncbi:hypothetical protein EVJ58_g39 [Rhodofomes roseus]|uniref:Acetyl-CoA acetyltransferase n=1 Tax=Rhodofomes roseus TaxID=34475 RepID=A0A4Y9Z9M4_9APHY|nr:hypothetical protein EVJ58_g39 [Rhodofomes roseus]
MNIEYSQMGLEAATKALLDAGITYDAVETAFVGYCYGDSTSGQRSLYNLGLTGIPITNVNNNCSTGSTALYHANNMVASGLVECALALGFERMAPGSLGTHFPDRPSPIQTFSDATAEAEHSLSSGVNHGPNAPRMFANAAQEYMDKHGATRLRCFSYILEPYTLLTTDQDGAACCIVASEDFVHEHGLENQAIEIVAQALCTDEPSAFESKSAMEIVGYGMTRNCADKVFKKAGFGEGEGRDQVGVVELHDCFAANELVTYEALGLCGHGEAHKMVEKGDNTYGGKYVVNPSGGLEAKGHPLGATGLGMHFYIAMQLRDWAGPMQAPGLLDIADRRGKYGLVHNIGIGGAVVCSLLRRPEFYRAEGEDGRSRLGYNHAHECRPITKADVNKVKSVKFSPYIFERARL